MSDSESTLMNRIRYIEEMKKLSQKPVLTVVLVVVNIVTGTLIKKRRL